MTKLSFVIPCFNNEENIDDLFAALFENEKQFSNTEFEYIMVDDASKDGSRTILKTWQNKFPSKIETVFLQKNIGSHKAVFKGFESVSGDCICVMAADLQDPPQLSKQLFSEWKKGNELVIAEKENPTSISSRIFHFAMRSFFVKNPPKNAFDYVLFDKSLLPNLQKPSIKNCNLFYRLVEIQPNYTTLFYTKQQRKKGKSGWTFLKKIKFFTENILCFSLAKFGFVK